jgi:hypothetical protein
VGTPTSRRAFLKAVSALTGEALTISSRLRDSTAYSATIVDLFVAVSTQPSLNVRNYGASPRATARQNIAAFQRAEAALPKGGRVMVPAGAYDMTASRASESYTVSTSGLEIWGEGDATILKTTNADTYQGDLFGVINVGGGAVDIADVTLRDFKVLGPARHTGGTIPVGAPRLVNGVCVNEKNPGLKVSRVTIRNVKAANLLGCAFQIGATASGTYDVVIEGCWAIDNRNDGFNIIAGNVYRTTAKANHAVDCDGFGFEMAGAGTHLANNIIRRCGQAGIGIELNPAYGANHRTVIRDNTIEDCYTKGYPDAAGISLGQSVRPFNVDILYNAITRVGGSAITGGPGGGTDIVIEGNVIKDIGRNKKRRTAIDLTSPKFLRIGNNRIDTRTPGFRMDYAISLDGAGSDTNIIGPNEIVGAVLGKHAIVKNNRIIE